MKTEDFYFVVRDTNHPAEDLQRNWSAPVGGFSTELAGRTFKTRLSAEKAEKKLFGFVEHEFRYHEAYQSFVEVHYEGLGAWALDSETIEEAIDEAKHMRANLACTTENGSGHFYAEDVLSYHQVREGRYVFKIKC